MSQEYTPVDWVDETTSQQGTLINAERLNQMQTAHHYADGFEEVDAIPTEDPGVDYHKVVYCTADATFYRWDGEVWTADIDESTKHLLDQEIARAEHAEGLIQGYLDAHEANHNNPHQVTKAQVGLGNCDNTADLDKPISTAVQAALDTKADKASTLAGYGITDAYTKAQADTLLADKADKADVYDKTAADTLLAGKVDKLVSSPAGTYKSVTVNAQGQVTAGTNPDTLAGYGITDAYNKTEADNLLATKADKATTLAGYGITDAVNTTGNQNNIVGAKTFTTSTYLNRNWHTIIGSTSNVRGWTKMFRLKVVSGTMIHVEGISTGSQTPHNVHFKFQQYSNGANAPMLTVLTSDIKAMIDPANFAVAPVTVDGVSYIDYYLNFAISAYSGLHITVDRKSRNEGTAALGDEDITYYSNTAEDPTGLTGVVYGQMGNAYIMAQAIDQRAYNAANTDDIATIGTLDAYPPMVRTTNFQTIVPKKFSGSGKTIIESVGWNGGLALQQTVGGLDVGATNALGATIRWYNSAGTVEIGHIVMGTDAAGNSQLIAVLKDKDGTLKYITLATSA